MDKNGAQLRNDALAHGGPLNRSIHIRLAIESPFAAAAIEEVKGEGLHRNPTALCNALVAAVNRLENV